MHFFVIKLLSVLFSTCAILKKIYSIYTCFCNCHLIIIAPTVYLVHMKGRMNVLGLSLIGKEFAFSKLFTTVSLILFRLAFYLINAKYY